MSSEHLEFIMDLSWQSQVQAFSKVCNVSPMDCWVQGFAQFTNNGSLYIGMTPGLDAQRSDLPAINADVILSVVDKEGQLPEKELRQINSNIRFSFAWCPIESDMLSKLKKEGYVHDGAVRLKYDIEIKDWRQQVNGY